MEEAFFTAELIAPQLKAADETDAIRQVGALLEKAGYVNAAYVEAVLEREQNFPTGLQLAGAAIAIPHATPEGNVAKNGIAVAKLQNKVTFHSMEDPEETVEAELIFLLALKDSGQHLEVLREMFTSFQNPAVIEALKQSKSAEGILKVLEENFAHK